MKQNYTLYRGLKFFPLGYNLGNKSFYPFNEAEFIQFSQENGLHFSEEYKDFLRNVNGGLLSYGQQIYLNSVGRKLFLTSFNPFVIGQPMACHPDAWISYNEIRPDFLYELGMTSDDSYFYIGAKGDVIDKVFIFNEKKTNMFKRKENYKLSKDPGLIYAYKDFNEFWNDLATRQVT